MLDLVAILLVLTALLAYVNHRFVRLPTTIGVMAIALLLSSALLGLNALGVSALHHRALALLTSINFSEVLMQGMLSILLFAGALHVDLTKLRAFRLQIGLLAVFGTLISTIVVGAILWWTLPLVGLPLSLTYCMLFGALISPTDPIAVMGILKSAKAPESLELVIAGESLFNDGVGVVLFALIAGVLVSGTTPGAGQASMLLLQEAGGGVLFGLLLGYVTYRLLGSIDSYQEEVLITLAAVIGGYALATRLHISGPLAMVVAGLIIGNHGRALAMSDKTREHVDSFWELLDSILNAVLFVLIGLEVIVVRMSPMLGVAALITIAVTLLARYLSVGLPVALAQRVSRLPGGSWQVLTWGGLRGGISVALALSIPSSPERDVLVTLTYAVVVFSILVQGGSIGMLIRRWIPRGA
ncbi:cation:proton antiporter [Massilia scottii]|uniref:cation:proton antiporter n=1 Tax=Massilia scottii TaxID=3057166 RepID=UPI002796D794|nr:sodium:proton antiporter [Massilia sp. CCM 9029]MDQ1834145.1 sodium:proton antiporter [Massilia sp. CCM 9029]